LLAREEKTTNRPSALTSGPTLSMFPLSAVVAAADQLEVPGARPSPSNGGCASPMADAQTTDKTTPQKASQACVSFSARAAGPPSRRDLTLTPRLGFTVLGSVWPQALPIAAAQGDPSQSRGRPGWSAGTK
jgi:hypothetical protein